MCVCVCFDSNGNTNKIIIIIITFYHNVHSRNSSSGGGSGNSQFQTDLYSADTFESVHKQKETTTTTAANAHTRHLFQAVCLCARNILYCCYSYKVHSRAHTFSFVLLHSLLICFAHSSIAH